MEEVIAFLKAGSSFGTLAGWTQVAIWLAILWKGVPAFLDALTNRQSKLEERTLKLLSEATDRFNSEIEASNRRHQECEDRHQTVREEYEGQIKSLRDEFTDRIKKLLAEVDEARSMVAEAQQAAISAAKEAAGMRAANSMLQARLAGMSDTIMVPPDITTLVERVKKNGE